MFPSIAAPARFNGHLNLALLLFLLLLFLLFLLLLLLRGRPGSAVSYKGLETFHEGLARLLPTLTWGPFVYRVHAYSDPTWYVTGSDLLSEFTMHGDLPDENFCAFCSKLPPNRR